MATVPFIENYDVYQGEHHATATKVSTGLIAYEKLARELRRWTILLERGYAWISCDIDTAAHHKHRQSTDTAPDPDSLTVTATYPFVRRERREHRGSQNQNQDPTEIQTRIPNQNEFSDPDLLNPLNPAHEVSSVSLCASAVKSSDQLSVPEQNDSFVSSVVKNPDPSNPWPNGSSVPSAPLR